MNYDTLIDVSFGKLAVWFSPKRFRKTLMIILLRSSVAPVIALYNDFIRYRNLKLYQIMITPQVCYLERLLNDRFDLSLRRITIGEPVYNDPWYLYQEEELKPEFLYQESEALPAYIFTDGEAGASKDDFTVLVPLDIDFDINQMSSLLNQYKLFGKRYKIQRI